MSDDITGLCHEHSFETAEEVCRRCGGEYCELCLLYPFGANKPMCKECAMVAGGVRSHTGRPEMKGRELRRKVKAFEQRRTRAAGAAGATVEVTDPTLTDPLTPTDEDLARVTVPADAAAAAPAEAADAERTDDRPPPPPAPAQDPGVAPPIDWSQPFG